MAGGGHQTDFVISHYGAFGRLAMLILANICPCSAFAALSATLAAPRDDESTALDELPQFGPPSLDDVIASPEAWHQLLNRSSAWWSSPREQGSRALGKYAFDNMVRSVRQQLHRRVPAGKEEPGYELGFRPPVWWSAFDPRPNLRDAARRVPPAYREQLPACYRKVSGDVHEFCIDVAAELRPGLTPHADDPAYLYGPDLAFRPGQLGAAGWTDTAIASAMLAGKAGQVVEMAKAGTAPRLAGPSPATMRKRRKRTGRSGGAGKDRR